MNNIKKSLKIISDEGIFSFFIKLFKLVLSKIFTITRLIIFELYIEDFENTISPAIELSYRIATEEDIESMDEEKYNYDKKGKQFSRDRLKKGDICVLAIYKDRIAGYVWIMYKQMELSQGNYITLSDEKVYFYKGWVVKDMRGKRIHNKLDAYRLDIVKRNKKKIIITVMPANNNPVIKARKRLGFKAVGNIYQIRFFGIKYDYISKNNLQYLQESCNLPKFNNDQSK